MMHKICVTQTQYFFSNAFCKLRTVCSIRFQNLQIKHFWLFCISVKFVYSRSDRLVRDGVRGCVISVSVVPLCLVYVASSAPQPVLS